MELLAPTSSESCLVDEIDVITLDDILAGISAYELDINDLFGGDNVAGTAKPRSASKRRSLPYKPRHETLRKVEMRNLKSQVDELQSALAQIQWQKRPAPQSPWLRIAMDQRRLRSESEALNKELRRLVNNFWGDATKMERLLSRLERMRRVFPRTLYDAGDLGPYRGPTVDPVYQFRRLDRLALEEEDMFSNGMFASSLDRSSFKELELLNCSTGKSSLAVVFSMRWELPFTGEVVADAVWTKLTQVASEKKRVSSEVVYSDSDSILTQFIAQGGETIGDEHGRMAARRRFTTHRSSFLMLSSVQLHVLGDTQLKGFAESDHWVRVVEIPTVSDPHSVIEWCCRGLLQPSTRSQPKRAQWIREIIAAVDSKRKRKLDKTVQALENLALDASLAMKKKNSNTISIPSWLH